MVFIGEQNPRREIGPLVELGEPPFVNHLLYAIRPVEISLKRFLAIAEEARPYEEGAMLTTMTRTIDRTGLIPNFIGSAKSPEKVYGQLMHLANAQLRKIREYGKISPEVPQEIFDALQGGRATLRSVLLLDSLQEDIIREVTEVRNCSPLALAVRRVNRQALTDLYQDRQQFMARGGFLSEVNRIKLRSGEPRICYIPTVRDGAVVFVQQYFIYPRLSSVSLGGEFGAQTVADLLAEITPDCFKRKHQNSFVYDAQTPEGFMGLLGKVAGALPHFLAKWIKQDEGMMRRVMEERESRELVVDMLRRH